ncbi:MAG: methyl-accepting chemotaxis protein [Clostridia bacterium]|nr:methyl-accepting chemotaxis protein [Clostridia bacterium]
MITSSDLCISLRNGVLMILSSLKNGMAAGTTVTFDSHSTLKNFEGRYVISPVTIGDSQWWVGSTAPVKEITKATTNIFKYGTIAAVVSCILISVILVRLISRSIRPISGLVEVADRLAQGDVNVNVEATTTDEIGTLMHAFGKMIASIREQASAAEKIAAGDLTTQVSVRSEGDLLGKKLSEMIQMNNDMLASIYSAADQVAAGAKQISDSSISLSRGAIEQASSIEELTASMEEISGQTRQNAEHANQANTLAEAVKASAERGNLQMGNMLKAMQDINDSSVQIANIIKVIEGIAFQTNILALNAAVEAARAGEHGKGFAVVADEVRNLAARSAQAAQETTEMIEGSVRKVEDGTRIANETAGALHEIVQGIENVAGLVSGIASASTQQTQGIEQINQGIMQVSQVVQTNSATSEEGAAASEELASQAELLKDHVGHFKLKKSENVSL